MLKGFKQLVFLAIIAALFPQMTQGQCTPVVPPASPVYSMAGRTITVTNLNINGSGNYLTLAPGAAFNVAFDWSIGSTITACPGCVTFFHFGLSNVSVPGSASATTYPNTHCMGSVYAGQSSSSSGAFTAPLEDGYYYITLVSKWVYWCHQFSVNHCNNARIGLIKIGNPPTLSAQLDSLTHLTGCQTDDGSIGISVYDYVSCFRTTWTGPNGFTATNQTVLTDLAAGDYQVVVSDISGCDTTMNFTINDVLQDEVDIGRDTALCPGQTLLLDATYPGAAYEWQDGSTSSSFLVSQGGTYWVEVTSGNCSTTDSVLITYQNFTVNLGPDTSICNNALMLDAGTPGGSYLWQNGATGQTLQANTSGVYWVDVMLGGCTERDSLSLTVDPAIVVDLGNDRSICGDSELLDATTSGATYLWQDGSGVPTFTAGSDGTYWVEVTRGSCTLRDSVTLDFELTYIIDLGPDTVLCDGNLTLDATTPGGSYSWQDGSQNPTYQVSSGGAYSVTVSTGGPCPDQSDNIVVDYADPLIFSGFDDVSICNGETYTAQVPLTGVSVLWSDGSGGTSQNFTSSGIYWVEVSNSCEAVRDTFTVSSSLCGCKVMAPSAFTPNSDGLNDLFILFPQCDINNFRVRIYNRWGEPVYATSEPQSGWNGIFKGKPAEMDTYSWVIDYTVPLASGAEEQVRQTGVVQLLR